MDQILKANELSISLLAAVPAFVIAGSALYGLGRCAGRRGISPCRDATPGRSSPPACMHPLLPTLATLLPQPAPPAQAGHTHAARPTPRGAASANGDGGG